MGFDGPKALDTKIFITPALFVQADLYCAI